MLAPNLNAHALAVQLTTLATELQKPDGRRRSPEMIEGLLLVARDSAAALENALESASAATAEMGGNVVPFPHRGMRF